MNDHPWIPFCPKLTKCWSAVHVVSLITRWPLNLNGPLSLFLMSLALRLPFFARHPLRILFFSILLELNTCSDKAQIGVAVKLLLLDALTWGCNYFVWYQARAEIAGDLELGIYGHLCQALDPADKSVCLAAVRCENCVSKRLTLSLPPVSQASCFHSSRMYLIYPVKSFQFHSAGDV